MAASAQAAKEKGNAAFKSGDYVAAIGHYTDAALADRIEPTYPLNRAAAYLKLGKFADAERDCSTTLALSAGNVKALFRRAQARLALRKLDEAEQDLNNALKREPGNDAVKQEIVKLAQLRSEVLKSKKAPITVSPPTATPSGPIRRRIPITIVDDHSQSSLSSNIIPRSDFMTPVSTRPLNEPTPSTPLKSILKTSTPVEASTSFRAARETREQMRKPKVGGGIFKANGTHTLFQSNTANSQHIEEAATESGLQNSLPVTLPIQSQNVLEQRLPIHPEQASPTTLFALQREWAHQSSPATRWELLCAVPPSSLPALCKNSLEPAFLISMLETFYALLKSGVQPNVRNSILEYMDSLAKVSRFDTIVMFLSAREKDVARDLLHLLGMKSWAGIHVA